MSKAEEATNDFCTRCFDYNRCTKVQSECIIADSYQEGYEEGYHQAEKDLELTWEDVSKIRQIMFDYNRQLRPEIVENKASLPKDEEYCREVLKRFKAIKDEK